jgi:uncharacterized protein YdhG (YjbR/CyaY superfamily)
VAGKPKKTTEKRSVEAYIASFPEDVRSSLEALRQAIRASVPKHATETVRYNIGAFQLDGKDLIYFAGWKKHVSLYSITDEVYEAIEGLSDYQASGVTIKFPLGKPLPTELIAKIVSHRLADMQRGMGA